MDLVKLYLERGADPAEADAEAWASPLAWATKGGHCEIIELVRSRGTVAEGPAEYAITKPGRELDL
jgi:hypothetical protein